MEWIVVGLLVIIVILLLVVLTGISDTKHEVWAVGVRFKTIHLWIGITDAVEAELEETRRRSHEDAMNRYPPRSESGKKAP